MHLKQNWSRMIHFINHERQSVHRIHMGGPDAISLRHLYHIRQRHATFRALSDKPSKESSLRCPNREVAVVIENNNFYGQLMVCDGLQFLNIQLNTSIACKADDATTLACNRCANCCWEIIAHGCGAGIRNQTLTLLQLSSLEWNDTGGGVAADDDIVFF